MAIKLESTLDGVVGTIVETLIMMKDAEAGTDGEAMVVSAGRLTKCGATALPQFILAQNTAAGTNVATTYVRVRADQVYLVDIAGSAATMATAIGTKVVCLDSTGLKVDSAALTGGKCEIISVDLNKSKARVRFDV